MAESRVTEVLELIEEDIFDIVATANEAGFSTEEIIHALEQIVKNARLSLNHDPDPADDQ